MSLQLNGDTGVTFNDTSLQGAAASPYVLKNRIINGAMQINQRAFSGAPPSDTVYTLDRWSARQSAGSKFTFAQSSTAPSSYINSLLVTSSSAYSISSGDYFAVVQPIEGLNISDFAWGTASAKTITLSFQVYSSLTGTFGGALSNSASNRSYPFTYTISTANTWTSISITISGDTSGTWLTTNGVGVYVYLGLGVGSTYSGTAGSWSGGTYLSATGAVSVVGTSGATFYITGVQLEVGSTATPFERRLYNQELANCQRYYYKNLPAAGSIGVSSGVMYNTALSISYIQFPISMRTAPTGSVSSVSDFAAVGGGFSTAPTAMTFTTGTLSARIDCTLSGVTLGHGMTLQSSSSASFIAFSAEL